MRTTAVLESFKLNRFLSRPLTAFFLRTPATPNQVTCISLAFGLLAGFLFSRGSTSLTILGALAFQTAVVLDNCDGEIARAKNLKSILGGWLDIAVDVIVDIALFSGLTIGLAKAGAHGPFLLLGFLCILGSVINCLIVILQKIRGFGPAVFNRPHPEGIERINIFFQIIDALRDGDVSWFVVLFALFDKTLYLLWFSAFYMQILWLSAVFLNFKWMFAPPFRGRSKSSSLKNGVNDQQ